MITERWLKSYNLAKEYYEEHGNLLVPRKYLITLDNEVFNLGTWIIEQRRYYNNGTLDPNKIEFLNDIKMIWRIKNNDDVISDSWMNNYNYAKEYYKKYGNLCISRDYFVLVNEKKVNLGMWIQHQKTARKNNKLSVKKIELLDKIHINWIKSKDDQILRTWHQKYELAKKYYEEHDNLLIPANYDIYINNVKVQLGGFIRRQRVLRDKGKLSKEKIDLLDKIGMVWKVQKNIDVIKDCWMEKYLLAKKYYEKHGNLLIPAKYAEYYNSKECFLGWWIREQRKNYEDAILSTDKINLLNEIEMVWKVRESNIDWNKHYLLLKEYKEAYGDTFILNDYVYVDSSERINLYDWLNDQISMLRVPKNSSSALKHQLLDELGVTWSRKISFNILKEYIEKQYSNYILGTLSNDDILKLTKSGALKYVDDSSVEPSNERDFALEISKRNWVMKCA